MFLIDDLLAAKAVGKLLPLAIGATVLFGVGFGAAEVYEHSAPWGLRAQRDRIRDSIPEKTRLAFEAGVTAQAQADAPAFAQWRTNLSKCEAARDAARNEAAGAIADANAIARTEAARAFRLGRATCGATDATSPSPGPSPDAGGLLADDDLLESYRPGSFTPAR